MADALRSIEDLQDDREAHAAEGDLRAAAGCDREIGIALAEAGKLEAALDRLTAARSLLDEGDRDVAICDHCLGIVLARLGREHEALQRLERRAAPTPRSIATSRSPTARSTSATRCWRSTGPARPSRT